MNKLILLMKIQKILLIKYQN